MYNQCSRYYGASRDDGVVSTPYNTVQTDFERLYQQFFKFDPTKGKLISMDTTNDKETYCKKLILPEFEIMSEEFFEE